MIDVRMVEIIEKDFSFISHSLSVICHFNIYYLLNYGTTYKSFTE